MEQRIPDNDKTIVGRKIKESFEKIDAIKVTLGGEADDRRGRIVEND